MDASDKNLAAIKLKHRRKRLAWFADASADLRRNATVAERCLYERLSDDPTRLGWKWQFQKLHSNYILDLYEPDRRLAVEIDGKHHRDDPEQVRRDRERDASLLARGVRTLRFSNEAVLRSLDDVVRAIADAYHAPRAPARAFRKKRIPSDWIDYDLPGERALKRMARRDPQGFALLQRIAEDDACDGKGQ